MAKHRKSQIELWMLSKFAILFFIMALAIFLFTFSEKEKGGLCGVEAGSQASLIAGSISNVLNSPVEDQQLVVKMPPAITIGSGLSAYTVAVDYINQSSGPSIITVQASSISGGCTSTPQTVFFPQNVQVYFYNDSNPNPIAPVPNPLGFSNMSLAAYPSSSDLNVRTNSIIVVKCTSKTVQGQVFLFVITCVRQDFNNCFNLNNAPLNGANYCGFS